ncbi:kinase domain protein, putative (macronuclear) [Tetrahymena thermophila SB210]|uniref:Kinase domain protein, putative n=1 Tax=Tetrahymena thermophila (strain SB210) TaxID=312017 RepID=W7XEU2_TETTS|nr:kinase domain protein, putative [Tetrahymena thermophila SB210]EWS75278.1 kinase domain protein, putative [Tetrahymena thermophila SB210]|eukprot:XP_012652269.1 kinase domain protein, putative [Tetrahymena thermophila SB210]
MGNLITFSQSSIIDQDCKELNLEFNQKLSDKQLQSFCQKICHLQKLNVLRLSFRNLSTNSQQKITKLLKEVATCPSLQQIEIAFDDESTIQQEIVQALNQGLNHCQNINFLEINFYCCDFWRYDKENSSNDSNVKSLSGLLSSNSNKIQSIRFSLFWISNSGLLMVLSSLNQCSNINNLHLQIGKSVIFVDGIQSVSQSISNLVNLKTLQLQLHFKLTDEYIKHLCEGIQKSKQLYKFSFTLPEKSQLTDNSIQFISEAIVQLPKLQLLSISLIENNFGEQSIGQILGESISKCQNLTYLFINLAINKISQDDAEILCHEISKSPQLNYLCIYFNKDKTSERFNNQKKLRQISLKTKKLIYLSISI